MCKTYKSERYLNQVFVLGLNLCSYIYYNFFWTFPASNIFNTPPHPSVANYSFFLAVFFCLFACFTFSDLLRAQPKHSSYCPKVCQVFGYAVATWVTICVLWNGQFASFWNWHRKIFESLTPDRRKGKKKKSIHIESRKCLFWGFPVHASIASINIYTFVPSENSLFNLLSRTPTTVDISWFLELSKAHIFSLG